MRTPASIAGHPIHPMLVPIPIGLWIFSFVCDLAYAELLGRGQREQDLEALLVRDHREHRTDPPETGRVGHALPKAQR